MKKLNRSSRGLFIKSYFLQSPKENELIRKKLISNDYQNLLTSQENIRLRNNIDIWTMQCRKEWQRLGHNNMVLINNAVEKPHCELCNQRLSKKKFHVKNKYTGEVLWVGSECYEKIINNIEGMLGQSFTPEEAKLFEEFRIFHPEVMMFLDNNPTNEAKFVLPKYIIEDVKRCTNDIKRYIKKHVMTNLNDKEKLMRLIYEIEKTNKEVSGFNERSTSFKNLPSHWAAQIKDVQSDAKTIIQRISDNKGMIFPEVAQSIKIKPFLLQYIQPAKGKWNDVSLGVHANGEIDIKVDLNHKQFVFSMPSNQVIAQLGYPLNINQFNKGWDLFNLLNYKNVKITPVDVDTTQNLQLISLEMFNEKGYMKYNFKFEELKLYISKRESGFRDKTNISKKRFESFRNQFVFYEINGQFLCLDSSKLQSIGFRVLERANFDIPEETLDMQKRSKKSILEDFYKDMQLWEARVGRMQR